MFNQRVFAALADPTRRDLVARLAVGDATVDDVLRSMPDEISESPEQGEPT